MNPIFVYGILKGRYDSREGIVPNFRLIDMGYFPAAVPGRAKDAVIGELIEVDDATVENFDRIEGAPNFYERQKVEVITTGGDIVQAEMYVVNNSYHDAPSLNTTSLEVLGDNDGPRTYEYFY